MQVGSFNEYLNGFKTQVDLFSELAARRLDRAKLDLMERQQSFLESDTRTQRAQQERKLALDEATTRQRIQVEFAQESRRKQVFDAKLPVMMDELATAQLELAAQKKAAVAKATVMDLMIKGKDSPYGGAAAEEAAPLPTVAQRKSTVAARIPTILDSAASAPRQAGATGPVTPADEVASRGAQGIMSQFGGEPMRLSTRATSGMDLVLGGMFGGEEQK